MKPNVLLCCSGSVATLKVPELVVSLHSWANVFLVCSQTAKHFLDKSQEYNPSAYETFLKIKESENIVITDADEWITWNQKGDPVLHIELRRWADLLLIAPASANTIAKAANGICDNLMLCVVRAWDPLRPAICCPAMNTTMLGHPSMATHIALLKSYGFQILEAEVKELACGDIGKGALVAVSTIVNQCRVATSTMPHNSERRREIESARENIVAILRSPERRSDVLEPREVTNDSRSSLQCSITVACCLSVFVVGVITGIHFRSLTNSKNF